MTFITISTQEPFDRRIRAMDEIAETLPKQQVETVRKLKGNIESNVKIIFAGTGPQFEELKIVIGDDPHFETLGFVHNIYGVLVEFDYLIFFSIKKGFRFH